MNRLALFFFLIAIQFSSVAQTTRYVVVNNGVWSSASTWNTFADGSGVSGVPLSTDIVRTNGKTVKVDTDITIRRLLIEADTPDGVIYDDSQIDPFTITITQDLLGYTLSGGGVKKPTVAVIGNSADLTFKFTGTYFTSGTATVIRSWSVSAPINNIIIDPSGGTITTLESQLSTSSITGGEFLIRNSLNITSGIFKPNANIGQSGSATITVSNGSTLDLSAGNISGDAITNSTKFNNIVISGIVTTTNTNFFNTDNITLNSNGVININASGANQTQGWWFQSTSPTGTITLNGTVSFGASADQSVFTLSYGDLRLGGSGTKTVTATGSLNISRDLTFVNTGITFNSSQLITFNGSTAQQITGGGTANFNGLVVNKSGGSVLTLSQNISVLGGLTLTAGSLNFGSNTISLSGNLVNNGTIVPVSGTLVITGSTSISGSSSTTLNNLTINGSGSLTAPPLLTITGDLSNSGSFNANNGTLVFGGASAQSISGASTTTANNMTVNTSAGLSINGNVNLSGALTLGASGVFDADGTGAGVFTVKSTSQNATGQIAAIPNTGNFSGDVTVERYIHATTGGDYRYLSMPITSGQNNLSRWKSAIGVTGSFSDRSTNADFANISDAGNTNPSVFTYNGSAYVAVTGSTTTAITVDNKIGYVAYDFSNAAAVATYRGSISLGNISVAISSVASTFNLVPNPYPSAIDWDNVTRTGLNNSMWLRTGNNTYSSYINGVATNLPFTGWTGEVATGQSFFTQSSGGTSTLTLKETDKTSNASRFLRTEEPINYFRITLASPTQVDDAVIRFAADATDNTDNNYDAVKRRNGNYVSSLGANNYLNLSSYTTAATTDYSINGVNLISCSKTINLKVKDVAVGNFTLTFSELTKMQLGYTISLVDMFLNKEQVVSEGFTYNFSVTSDPASFGDTRFAVKLSSPSIAPSSPNYTVSNVCNSNYVTLTIQTQAGVSYKLLKGAVAVGELIGNGNLLSLSIDRSKLDLGKNTLDVNAATIDGCNASVYRSAIEVTITNAPSITSAQATGTICTTGSATLLAAGAPLDGSYKWYRSLEAIEPISGVTGNSFTTPELSSSQDFYVSAVNSFGCEGAKSKVTATVVSLQKPQVTTTGQQLVSSSPTGNQWYKNGEIIAKATGQTLIVQESGSYSVKITSSGCSAVSDNVVITITGIETLNTLNSAYPNPVVDFLNLQLTEQIDSQLQSISLYDTKGSELMSSSIDNSLLQKGVKSIDMSNYKSGLYLLSVKSNNSIYVFRIIKK